MSYFYPAVYYAAQAVRVLQNENHPDDASELKEIVTALRKILMTKWNDQLGLFEPLGKSARPSSSAYVNPLAGLALLELADLEELRECEKSKNESVK